MLKGQAKKDYQREYMRGYMRDRRLKKQDVKTPKMIIVKTSQGKRRDFIPIIDPVQPRYSKNSYLEYLYRHRPLYIDADGNPVYGE